mgnify:CR=1 FL=1
MSVTPERSTASRDATPRSAQTRRLKDSILVAVCVGTASLSVLVLVTLLTSIAYKGFGTLTPEFLSRPPSSNAAEAGISAALFGSLWVCTVCILFTVPIGVGTAIFLEEFQPRNWLLSRIHSFVQLNISNLAGVPSVVYGMIGVAAFVYMFSMFGRDGTPAFEFGVTFYDQVKAAAPRTYLRIPVEGRNSPETVVKPGMQALINGEMIEVNVIERTDPLPRDKEALARTVFIGSRTSRVPSPAWYYVRLPLGSSVLAAGLTLMLVILPVVIIASQESLRAVPQSLREAAFGLGCTRWQVVRNVTLPAAIPGIMTGSILAMSRAIGEAAPILMISGTLFMPSGGPGNLMDDFTVMPLQIYNWTKEHREGFQPLAASGIIVLLGVLFTFNAIAIFVRQRMQKPLS